MELATKLTNGDTCLGFRSRISESAKVCAVTGSPVLNLYLPGGTVNVTVRPSDEMVGIADAASGWSW